LAQTFQLQLFQRDLLLLQFPRQLQIPAPELQVRLPSNRGAPQDLFWTAPDAVLADARSAAAAAALVDRLRVGLAGHHAACHAIGDARARFDVTGAASRGLLVKGTGIDLDARVFAPGTAALTRFALLSVLLVCRDAAPSFSIFADRPIAAYLWDWLVDAARGGMP
jgi:heterotetrameric sarcosine oxidase gamma subunit